MAATAWSQAGLCPPNLDMEMGDFTNWLCRTGTVSAPGNVNTINWTGSAQINNRHTIISAATGGVDQYGGFPQACPNGSGYSVKLGNNSGGAGAESISYTYSIPANIPFFSMMFHYAVVLQDPNHLPWQQPRFRARITDLSANAPISCVTFDFTASALLPGFQVSPVNSSVIYKDWTPVTINLSPYIGRTIQLEFITSDCTFSAHFGYAYVDVNSNCNGAIAGTTLCEGNNSIRLTAPFGFQSYQWYSDNSFSSLLANTQVLSLNPAPTVGTVFPVVVTPFPGFGCKDTLFATITISPKPVSRAGPDTIICKYGQVQIGVPGSAGFNYEWSPAGQVSNPTVSNPLAWTYSQAPQEFIVKTTDILTGCFSFDTTIITNHIVDTALRVSGTTSFCAGGTPPVLSVNSGLNSIQWFNNDIPIAGETAANFQPALPGRYWAQVSQFGCTDSTSGINVLINPIPVASFIANTDTGCVTNNSFLFANRSAISTNEPLSYSWSFSDGTNLQTTDATKSFTSPGHFDVELITTSASGCKDTAEHTVHVFPNGVPHFTYDSICTNRAVLFRNLSIENGSPTVQYAWNFNNGDPLYNFKDPPPVFFPVEGTSSVSLRLTALGCASEPVTISRTITVNKPLPSVRYSDLTVPQGSSAYIHARDIPGGSYTWRPQVQLSSFYSRYAQFYATGGDVRYFIDVKDKHTCVTTDTLLIQVLKKPGFYLPTGFTPNGDGLNDVVKPYLIGMKSLKSFSVFNRWGNRIYYTTVYGEGWNGKYNGLVQNPGVYVWILEFFDTDNKLITEKGTISIIR